MFRIAHITDLHIPPLPAMRKREMTIKRILGYLSWHRKRKSIHSIDVLDVLRADVAVHKPDHIMISGDVTNLSLDAEFLQSAEWFETLGVAEDISVIPGNHDAYSRDPDYAVKYFWTPFTRDDDGNQGFPFVRKRGNVAIIGVSSSIRTFPLMANGRVSDRELEALRALLHDLKAHHFCRIVMVHHPPQKNATSARRALSNAAAFREVIEEAGAELILHGHEHEAIAAVLAGPSGIEVPVRGAGSGSSTGAGHKPPAHYHVIEVAEDREGWNFKIIHREIDPARRVFSSVKEENLKMPKH